MEENNDVVTKAFVRSCIGYLGMIYPKSPYASLTEENLDFMAEDFYERWAEYPLSVVKKALRNATNKSKGFPPTVGQIYEEIQILYDVDEDTAEYLWSFFESNLYYINRNLNDYGFTFRYENGKTQGEVAQKRNFEIYENLPYGLKLYIKSAYEMSRLARGCYEDETTCSVEKGRFLKAYPKLLEREKTKKDMGEDLLKIVQGVSDGMALLEGDDSNDGT